ncbi:MAG: hypothetical protein JW852_10005 [Spirochaetales bacterium]|nr:hypothetical protein [Spirochaetales bacterium]
MLQHAAVLVLDENESLFIPAAFIGFDSTTKRRLRIPREIVDQHGTLAAGQSLSLTGKDRAFLEPFFSVREYGCLERIDLSAVLHDSTIYAVLLAGWQEGEKPALPFKLLPVPAEYGETLYRCHCAKMQGLASPPYFSDKSQATAGLKPLVDRCRDAGRSLQLCTVSVTRLLQAVQPSSPSADLFKFREDIRRILYSAVAPGGIYYEKDNGETILGFSTTSVLDCGFLSRHLILSINDFFPALSLPDSIVRTCKSVPCGEIPVSPPSLFD